MNFPPLLIQLDLLVDDAGEVDESCLPRLAELNQAEIPIILLAPRPDTWRPTRSGMDSALSRQGVIEAAISQAGGAMDAVLYLDFGLFGRRRHRRAELRDLATRYDCEIEDLIVIAAPSRLADAVQHAGGHALDARDPAALEQRLREILESG